MKHSLCKKCHKLPNSSHCKTCDWYQDLTVDEKIDYLENFTRTHPEWKKIQKQIELLKGKKINQQPQRGIKMSQVTYTENKEENCDGNVVFTLNGTDYGTGFEFENNTYYYTHDGRILYDDGCPMECEFDEQYIAVMNVLKENGIVN